MTMIRGYNQPILMTLVIMITIVLSVGIFSGCIENGNGGKLPKLTQTGSSTVLPLALAWAEEFDKADISVSGGGSSHGINSLLNKEADLGDASRLMKGSDFEKVGCDQNLVNKDGTANAACNGVLPIKWIVAYDVLTVIITIVVWEILKDILDVRNIFDKYDGLSTEETLAVRRAEVRQMKKQRELENKKKREDFVDD